MEEEKEEEKENEKEDSNDINPEVAVELQVSDLDVESVTPEALATSTTPSCDDMRKKDLQEEE